MAWLQCSARTSTWVFSFVSLRVQTWWEFYGQMLVGVGAEGSAVRFTRGLAMFAGVARCGYHILRCTEMMGVVEIVVPAVNVTSSSGLGARSCHRSYSRCGCGSCAAFLPTGPASCAVQSIVYM
mmetsp:Transcript_88662/g.237077  ORF Transcript_88662/g.237077 Transcript_88662/m.237077 type:complete len:124 (+) Transcript_88662:3005-3376(+)